MRDGTSRETEMERDDDRYMETETDQSSSDGVEKQRAGMGEGGVGGVSGLRANAKNILRAAPTCRLSCCPGSVGSTWWRQRTCCRSMDCWRGTSRPRVSGWRHSMLLPCVSPSFRVSLRLGIGVETFRAGANRSRMSPERQNEGVSSPSLEASKHQLGSHSIRDITWEISALSERLDHMTSSCFEILQ